MLRRLVNMPPSGWLASRIATASGSLALNMWPTTHTCDCVAVGFSSAMMLRLVSFGSGGRGGGRRLLGLPGGELLVEELDDLVRLHGAGHRDHRVVRDPPGVVELRQIGGRGRRHRLRRAAGGLAPRMVGPEEDLVGLVAGEGAERSAL